MTKNKIRLVFLVAGTTTVICAAVLRPAIAGWGGGGASPKQSPAIAVKLAPVQQQDVPIRITAVATVMPFQTVAVRSRLDSQIMEVKFHDGDTVKKGDVLFLLDDRALKAQKVQTQANLARDRAQLDNARRQFDRLAKLGARGFASKADQDNARAAYETAQANVGADQAALENISVQLGYTTILAPIDGRTGTINVTVGNTVKANDVPLVTINQIRPIYMQASLPQDSFDSLRAAMQTGVVPAVASRNDADKVVTENGRLAYIDNAIDQATGTFVVRASFDNPDESLWPGMLGTLTLQVGSYTQATTVPEVALQHAGDETFVYVVAEGKAHKKDVTVKKIQSGLAIIAKGLTPGEQVTIDGMMSLQDGSDVTTASAPASGNPG